ncbi:hypothetical protein [Corynebacterium timonense]|uniref:hypothetical protein n=1 Tax=Corynebacterium timonense TaxID=441500 RepID=UPI00156165BB|nr:hypothetical protein [Corynebacterium timonense]
MSFTIGDALAFNAADWTNNPATTRALWALPLTAAVLVLMVQGLGWIVRNTAGAVTLAFGLQFVLERSSASSPASETRCRRTCPLPTSTPLPSTPLTLTSPCAVLRSVRRWAAALWVIGIVLLERRDV